MIQVIGQLMIEDLPSPILLLAQRDPNKLPWKDYGVDVVLECTKVGRQLKSQSPFAVGSKESCISAHLKVEV